MQPGMSRHHRKTHNRVSILIRPEGRMQRNAHCCSIMFTAFQSSSGQKAGCNPGSWAVLDRRVEVSILIRPEGRMQRDEILGHPKVQEIVSILIRPEGRMQRPYLNFLSVLREPPDTGLPICFHCPDHFFPPATIQLRTRTSRLQWFRHGVRVRPPGVP